MIRKLKIVDEVPKRKKIKKDKKKPPQAERVLEEKNDIPDIDAEFDIT